MKRAGRVSALLPRILLGAGLQARHVLDLMRWSGMDVAGIRVFDDRDPDAGVPPCGIRPDGNLRQGIERCLRSKAPVMVALGSRCAALRFAVFQQLEAGGVPIASVVHPSAVVAPSAELGPNAIVMPGCVVASRAKIGALVCMFSNVTVEHDCIVGANVTLGPGATLSGFVKVGEHAFVGAGATISPQVAVGARALIGAGGVAVGDIEEGKVAVGVPARTLRAVTEGDDAPTAGALRELHLRYKDPARLARAGGA